MNYRALLSEYFGTTVLVATVVVVTVALLQQVVHLVVTFVEPFA